MSDLNSSAGPDSAESTLGAASRILLGDLDLSAGDAVPERDRVEPFLAALLQAEHLNVLVGSGLTTGMAHAAGADSTEMPDMGARIEVDDLDLVAAIEDKASKSAAAMLRGEANIEDRLRVAMIASEGLGMVDDPRAEQIQTAIEATLTKLLDTVASVEKAIAMGSQSPVGASTMTVQGLLMAFLGSFAGRTPTRDRLHVFTTNYDRLIEWGADLAGLRTVDRFVGLLQPVFRSSRLEIDFHYSPPGTVRDPRHLDGVFRLTKLHGSLDWAWNEQDHRLVRAPLPFGIAPTTSPGQLLIYPNSAKDVETTAYPYADLFRDFSAATCRPHTALVTYGYGFGDDHINRVLHDMLTIPSTHLLIVSYDGAAGRIDQFIQHHRRQGQVSLLIGPEAASLPALVGQWLPWPSAEFLLQRRAQIYRDRGASGPAPMLGNEAR